MLIERRRVAGMPDVRSVTRAATERTPAFELGYVRSGVESPTPCVVVPGGPGLASVLPYRAFRRRAVRRGLDVIMMEHRGVGLSRVDTAGNDLPASAMTVRDAADDLAAVLDAEGIERAIVYGSSYGSFLAQAFGAWHPERVAGMVLDSAIGGVDDHHAVRAHARGLLWERGTAAGLLREIVGAGTDPHEAGEVARIVYEFAGPGTLTRLLRARVRGRAGRTWRWVAGLGAREIRENAPFVMEFDLVGHIAFGELDFAPEPDGAPFDPATGFREVARDYPPFAGAPLDLAAHRPGFVWPVAVLTGERDLRTPPGVAREIAAVVPDGALLPLPATGHSALDTHSLAAVAALVAIRGRTHRRLAADPSPLAALPRTGASRHVGTLIRASLSAETSLPARSRRPSA